ncbi:hypothetical protein CMI47_07950 [Candidatus Pacearchaeota archaeon]|nr:hypothetical protein [Candidatus Pacearchaeota archaeon]
MNVGDLVSERVGLRRATGLVLASWLETQSGIGIEEQRFEVLWAGGVIGEHIEAQLEKANESR